MQLWVTHTRGQSVNISVINNQGASGDNHLQTPYRLGIINKTGKMFACNAKIQETTYIHAHICIHTYMYIHNVSTHVFIDDEVCMCSFFVYNAGK